MSVAPAPTAPSAAPASPGRDVVDGHLARLVQRARPDEALLQRRQPSLFEQSSHATHPRGEGDEPVDAVMAAPPAGPRAAEPLAARHSPPAAVPATPPVPRQAQRLPRETLRIDPSVRSVHAAAWPTDRPAARAAPELAMPQPASSQAAAPRQIQAASAPRPLPDRPHEEAAALHSRQPGSSTTPALARPTPVATPPTPLSRPVPAPPLLRPSPPRAAQRAAALQSPLSRQQAQYTPPPALPPVQVTIGRVEVRAVAAPAAAERKTRSAPRLSLEQYLLERQGGGR